MDTPNVIEIEPEVRLWLMNLPYNDFLVVEHVAELLRERPTTLGEPYSRHLGDGVRELRFTLGRQGIATRIPYWRETAEVARAKRAKVLCQTEHQPAHDVYTRTADEEKEKR